MSNNKSNSQYEVLSPWADADPVPQRGLFAARMADLAGKKIGLLCNPKRAARPISTAVESKLRERFPTVEFSRYFTQWGQGPPEIETENKGKYEEWINGVDAVVATVGD